MSELDYKALHEEGERVMEMGNFSVDFSTGELQCSAGLYDLLEYPPESRPLCDRQQLLDHVLHCEAQPMSRPDRSLPDGCRERTHECRVKTYAGNTRWLQVWVRQRLDASGQPVQEYGLVRNITRQRQQAQELQRSLEEMQASNRELEEFAYIASHDLQEPLRKISTFCGRLYARYYDQLDREGGQYLDRILASTENMRALINNLLDYSRIAQQEEVLQPTRLDVILIGIQSDLELIIEETRTRLTVDGLPEVMGNAPMLNQLFTNLIGNAIKFRKPGTTPEIRVALFPAEPSLLASAGLDDPQQHYHCIEVADNGIGFDQSQAEKIFQVFQRLHSKTEFPGTGIGLAICRKIAERHGGALIARSEEGQGARFLIFFPKME